MTILSRPLGHVGCATSSHRAPPQQTPMRTSNDMQSSWQIPSRLAAGATAFAAAQVCAQTRQVRLRGRRSVVAVAAAAADDPAVESLLAWGKTNGATLSPKLTIINPEGRSRIAKISGRAPEGQSRLGRGRQVVVQAPVDEGEVLVSLPVSSALKIDVDPNGELPKLPDSVKLPDAALEGLKRWWGKHTRSSVRIAAMLVLQKETFGPYIEMLPDLKEVDYAPWRWREEELRFLSTSMQARARTRKEALDAACDDLEAEGLAEWIPKDLFLRAHHSAASRAFTGQVSAVLGAGAGSALAVGGVVLAIATIYGLGSNYILDGVDALYAGPLATIAVGAVAASSSRDVLSMLPIIDQVNHESGPPPDINIDPLKNCWELKAARSYQVGEEVVISYGNKDSDSLLLQHGFVEQDNSADCLELPLPLDTLSASSKEAVMKANVNRVRFSRGGEIKGVVASKGTDDPEMIELESAVAGDVAKAALQAAIVAQAGLASNEEIERESATEERAQLILAWQDERARVLQEAQARWAVAK